MKITELISLLEQAKQNHGEDIEVGTIGQFGLSDIEPNIIYTIPNWNTVNYHYIAYSAEFNRICSVKLLAL